MPSFYILLSCFSFSVDILFKMQCHVNLVIGNKFLIFFMAFKFVLNFSIGSKLSWEQVCNQGSPELSKLAYLISALQVTNRN